MDTWSEFLQSERASRDCIDFKTAYVDMAGDILAGLLLSQVVYWYLPDKKGGSTKRRVHTTDGNLWVVKAAHEWWGEIRLTTNQARHAIEILKAKGLIETTVHRFKGTPTTHIRICEERFLEEWSKAIRQPEASAESRFVPQHESEMCQGTNPNCSTAQIHNIDYPENVETETTTSTCGAVAAELCNTNLDCLAGLGITEPKRSFLAGLPHVSPEYLRAIGESYQELRAQLQGQGRELGLGYLVVQIERGGPVPSRNGHRQRRRRDTLFSTSEERREKYARHARPMLVVTAGCEEAVCGQREPADSLRLTPASDQV